MTGKSWLIFIGMCVVLIGGLVYISQDKKIDTSAIDVTAVQMASEENGNIGDHTRGNKDASVVVIEYADYQCPGCKVAGPVVKASVDANPEDVLLIFRNYPLPSLHPNARAAAAAAEAAGLQDKFWEMHEKLFVVQDQWSSASASQRTDYFRGYAEELGLNPDQFVEDLSSPRVAAKIDYDLAIAQKLELSGTPSIFVNGTLMNDKYLDGEKVTATTSGGQYVWSSQELFTEHAILPALKKAGDNADDV